ncbi:MAG: YidC/Oxa1 family membrane protein insertase [Clostridia bacterium]|nr:YidC/Oxa1 family membrane protein insertase [Clostridia bacterium]
MWNTFCAIIGTPMGWIYGFVQNYGLSIVLFTILLKIVLFPISLKQHKSSMAMVRLRPYQDELMKKYGSNRQRYSEELQKLYQREGYNPMSSCLPMLLQMPLLLMMYTVIRRPLTFMAGWSLTQIWETAVADFGTTVTEKGVTILDNMGALQITAENFNRYESQILSRLNDAPLNVDFLGLNLAQVPQEVWNTTAFMILLIPALSGVTSFILSFLSQKMSPMQQASGDNPAAGNSKMMLYLMPIMSLWIAFTVPAGLGLYWLLSNVLGIAQLFVLNAIHNPKKVAAEVQAKIDAEKAKEKEKRAAAAAKKAQFIQGKKKKKQPAPQLNGEDIND